MPKIKDKSLYRIIDANFNRAKEGLRVCEDIYRFALDDKKMTGKYKSVRHKLTDIVLSLNFFKIIDSRNIEGDVGRRSAKSEYRRTELNDIFYANSQRIKESIRVLEEVSKLLNKKTSQDLKNLRYKIYALEKEKAGKL